MNFIKYSFFFLCFILTFPISAQSSGGGGGDDDCPQECDDLGTDDCGYCGIYCGCTDPSATNYSSSATIDDGTCTYDPDPYYGSFQSSAAQLKTNYYENPKELSSQIYPNPNNGSFELKIKAPYTHQATVSIYDLQGNQVFSTDLLVFKGVFTKQLDLKLPQGIYLLHTTLGNYKTKQKVIVN